MVFLLHYNERLGCPKNTNLRVKKQIPSSMAKSFLWVSYNAAKDFV